MLTVNRFENEICGNFEDVARIHQLNAIASNLQKTNTNHGEKETEKEKKNTNKLVRI